MPNRQWLWTESPADKSEEETAKILGPKNRRQELFTADRSGTGRVDPENSAGKSCIAKEQSGAESRGWVWPKHCGEQVQVVEA